MTKRDELFERIREKAQFRRENQPGMRVVPLDVADVDELLYWMRPRKRPTHKEEYSDRS